MTAKKNVAERILIDGRNRRIPICSFIPRKTDMQLVLVHGFSEHMRRYYSSAEELCGNGVAVHLMDLPGHGLSDGPRGHIDDFQEYVDNVDLLFTSNPGFLKTKPTFLLGHSLGGLIAAHYCLQKQPDLRGLILSSPLTGFSPVGSLPFYLLARLIARKNPARLYPNPSVVGNLTRNPAKWDEYNSDPYRLRSISPNLYLTMNTQLKRLQIHAADLELPLLVFYTLKDRVVSPQAIKRFYSSTSSEDKTLVTFTQAMHELFQERERKEIAEKLLAWMKQRV
ncbi:MAG: alpha/beta hydrolase [Proteobacteria bacterium]|nr:alpha/beta hydrolase [Pseudomonadota bacterium]